MEICSDDHVEIVHNERNCPLCETNEEQLKEPKSGKEEHWWHAGSTSNTGEDITLWMPPKIPFA